MTSSYQKSAYVNLNICFIDEVEVETLIMPQSYLMIELSGLMV